ncbi:hypothetical protein AGRA3207_002918 [Actinomadura graeca]|uniref:Uncharacterized protein n=1 Tax=Actinomadura graeca TaxID=2750812 RepID=A0ABX8QT80_9ACTN|nr:Rv3235 family protein [Actinomadura graeca]QXJ21995.1 hypothetical protein AGRA3207_002918 [Actinomadura graeca]
MGRRPVPPPAVRIIRYAPVPPATPPALRSAGRGTAVQRPVKKARGGGTSPFRGRPIVEPFGAPSGWWSFRGAVTSTDGALALSRAPVHARSPDALRLVRAGESVETELRARAEATVRIIADVLAGVRPAHRLTEVAVPAVCREIARLCPGRGRAVPPRVLSSWLQRPAPDAAEAGAVVAMEGRVKALAVRLELQRGRWRCTALETTGA